MFSDRINWNFWMWWTVLTAVGSTIAMFVVALSLRTLGVSILDSGVATEGPPFLQQLLVAPLLALAGAIVGFFQWLPLRTVLLRSGWWILATALGWTAGYLLTILQPPPASGQVPFGVAALTPWLVIGLTVGFAQWLFLRRWLSHSAWWIVASAAAIVIGTTGWVFGSICGGVFSWTAAGALTGYVLQWLQRRG